MKMLNLALVLLLFVTTGSVERVRLVGSQSPRSGRVEVYYNGTWGTICDDRFTDAAARVVCYMLGYRGIGQSLSNHYGAGRGRIWLDNVRCNGTETDIADCKHNDWGRNDCTHHEDVSVSCVQVRLTGGSNPWEGRLEVHHNGRWGTVCDDGFTDAAAGVVCYMLGQGHVGYDIGNRYGGGNGTIWLSVVRCSGMELHIEDCLHNGWGRHSCDHSEDVSVSCTAVRLAPLSAQGRLEVYHNGTWGTVCRNHFTHTAARVVCHMLGYKNVGQYIGGRYGAGSGRIWLDNVECSGMEMHIANCQHSGWGNHSCRHDEDVSVSCFSEVKLIGNTGSKGRLEIYYNGTWGTVCDDGFSNTEARVVCNSLGYGDTGRVIGNSYGAGDGPVWLDNVQCHGRESHITDCRHNGWGHHNCSHSDDVSVSCIANSTEAVALVGGGNPRVGRLEVFHGHQWGTVCDDGFTDAAARVVCYSLGFGHVGRKVDINLYGVGNGRIWYDNVTCSGTEEDIGECSHSDWRVRNSHCSHREDVAISCNLTTSVTRVRLVGNSNATGRLEVLHNGLWGTVCGDFFTAMNHASSAGCLDLHGEIKLTIATTLPIVVQSGWTGCNAVVQRGMLQNVHTVVGVFTTVNTMKMSLSPVLAPRLK